MRRRLRMLACAGVVLVAAACPDVVHLPQRDVYLGPPGSSVTHAQVNLDCFAGHPDVWRIRSLAAVGSRSGTALLPESAPTRPVDFPTSYVVTADGAQGTLQVNVEALDQEGNAVARARGSVELKTRDVVFVDLLLAPACNGDADCDDGRYCNGVERCVEGLCQVSALEDLPCPPSLFDCVQQTCVEAGQTCDIRVDHSRCPPVFNDGVPEPAYCDTFSGCTRGQPCTQDGDCQDASLCNGAERCVAGRCIAGIPPALGDDNPCTTDACVEGQGPAHFPVPAGNRCPLLTADDGICLAGACVPSRCGDGYLDHAQNEECDQGADNSDSRPGACRTTCRLPSCGDGVRDGEEECDDGTDPDPHCLTGCRINVCGDGVVESPREACDDGNQDDTDACLSTCVPAGCGDGAVAEDEECDDGNPVDEDACLSSCVRNRCGDGMVNLGVEECDDGNRDDRDGCTNACTRAVCGDGVVAYGEECDDGNQDSSDGCTAVCRFPRCGDGYRFNPPEGSGYAEECDDGNALDSDSCINCHAARCGDGIVRSQGADGGIPEECDQGADTDELNGCTTTCRQTRWVAEVILGLDPACPAEPVAADLPVDAPGGVAVGPNGDVVVATQESGQPVLLRVDTRGIRRVLAGSDGACQALWQDGTQVLAACGNTVDAYALADGSVTHVAGYGARAAPVAGPAVASPLYPVRQLAGVPGQDRLFLLLDSYGVDPAVPQVWEVAAGTLRAVDAVPLAGPAVGLAWSDAGQLGVLVRAGATVQAQVLDPQGVAAPQTLATLPHGGKPVTDLVITAAGKWLSVLGNQVVNVRDGVEAGALDSAVMPEGSSCRSVTGAPALSLGSAVKLAGGYGATVAADRDLGLVVRLDEAGQCWWRTAGTVPGGLPARRDGRCVAVEDVQEITVAQATHTNGLGIVDSLVTLDRLVVASARGVHELDLDSGLVRVRYPAETTPYSLPACTEPSAAYVHRPGQGLAGGGGGIRGLVALDDDLVYHSRNLHRTLRLRGDTSYQPVTGDFYLDADPSCCRYAPADLELEAFMADPCIRCDGTRGAAVGLQVIPRFTLMMVVAGPVPVGVPMMTCGDGETCLMHFVVPSLAAINYLTPSCRQMDQLSAGTAAPASPILTKSCGTAGTMLAEPAPYLAAKPGRLGSQAIAVSDTGNHRLYSVEYTAEGAWAGTEQLAGITNQPGLTVEPALARESRIYRPGGLGVDQEGNMFFVERHQDGGSPDAGALSMIRQVDRGGLLRFTVELAGLRTLVVHPRLGPLAFTDSHVYRIHPDWSVVPALGRDGGH